MTNSSQKLWCNRCLVALLRSTHTSVLQTGFAVFITQVHMAVVAISCLVLFSFLALHLHRHPSSVQKGRKNNQRLSLISAWVETHPTRKPMEYTILAYTVYCLSHSNATHERWQWFGALKYYQKLCGNFKFKIAELTCNGPASQQQPGHFSNLKS